MIFFKNISMSMSSGSSLDLWTPIMSRAVEKKCSLRTEVRGMERHGICVEVQDHWDGVL